MGVSAIIRFLVTLLLLIFCATAARAAESDQYCLTGTGSTGEPIWLPNSTANPCPSNAQFTGSVTATTTATAASSPPTVSAGTGQPLAENLSSSLYVQPTYAGTPVDGTHGFPVNCIVGCAGGTASNASSGVATSSTNGQTVAWIYGFNGTTWDQLKDDSNKYLFVDIGASSATVTVTGVGGTFPITAASLPLPTGAATAANQEVTAAGSSAASATVPGPTGSIKL